MATIALTAVIQLLSLFVLSLELDIDEAVGAYLAKLICKVPRPYRPSLRHQYHRFCLSDFDDVAVQEFTRYVLLPSFRLGID